jgi:extracellular solute-binding protein (family 5)
MTFAYSVTEPLLKDVTNQMPDAICELAPIGVNRSLIANRDKPPFDDPDLRHAMALSFDRKAFIDIVTEGRGKGRRSWISAPRSFASPDRSSRAQSIDHRNPTRRGTGFRNGFWRAELIMGSGREEIMDKRAAVGCGRSRCRPSRAAGQRRQRYRLRFGELVEVADRQTSPPIGCSSFHPNCSPLEDRNSGQALRGLVPLSAPRPNFTWVMLTIRERKPRLLREAQLNYRFRQSHKSDHPFPLPLRAGVAALSSELPDSSCWSQCCRPQPYLPRRI